MTTRRIRILLLRYPPAPGCRPSVHAVISVATAGETPRRTAKLSFDRGHNCETSCAMKSGGECEYACFGARLPALPAQTDRLQQQLVVVVVVLMVVSAAVIAWQPASAFHCTWRCTILKAPRRVNEACGRQ